jgi:hypothetical protein
MSCLTEPNSIAVLACWVGSLWASVATWWQVHGTVVWQVLISVGMMCVICGAYVLLSFVLGLGKVPSQDR